MGKCIFDVLEDQGTYLVATNVVVFLVISQLKQMWSFLSTYDMVTFYVTILKNLFEDVLTPNTAPSQSLAE